MATKRKPACRWWATPLAAFEKRAARGGEQAPKLQPKYDAMRGGVAGETARLGSGAASAIERSAEVSSGRIAAALLQARRRAEDALRRIVPGSRQEPGRRQDYDQSPHATCRRSPAFGSRHCPPNAGRRRPGAYRAWQFRVERVPRVRRRQRVDWQGEQAEARQAEADYSQGGFPPANAIDGKEPTGWAVGGQTGRDHWILFMPTSRSTRGHTLAAIGPAAKPWHAAYFGPVSRFRHDRPRSAAGHSGGTPGDSEDRPDRRAARAGRTTGRLLCRPREQSPRAGRGDPKAPRSHAKPNH